MIERTSPNFEPRAAGLPIDTLVIHYTAMPSEASLARLCDPAAKVSAHYLIDEAGAVYRLVDERYRAWHAGVSSWRGERDVNGRSIGIELVNPGHEFGYRPFPEPQMAALIHLAQDLLGRHPIPARNVVGHSDVAPARKQDPGELFDWKRLAEHGIGLWPERPLPVSPSEVPSMLKAFGYGLDDDLRLTVTAFQRHFRPDRIDGIADGETAGLLAALLAMAGADA